MTLSIRKSRPITIEGNSYRYQVSTTKVDKDGNYRLNLTIQSSKSNILLVKGLITRDYWLDFPSILEHDKSEYPIITSRHIIKAIKKARKEGWNHDGTDKRFVLYMTNEELFK